MRAKRARPATRRGRRRRWRRRRRRRSSPGTRTPSPGPGGRRDGGPRSAAASEPPYIMGRWPPPPPATPTTPRPSPRCAPPSEVDGVFACTRKERQISRGGTPYLTVELRDSTGTILARAFRDADLLAGRFERGELVRVRGPRRALSRAAADRRSTRSRAPRARRPTRRASCRAPTATSTSSKASSSTSRARSTTRALSGLLDALLGDRRAARAAAARAVLACRARPAPGGPAARPPRLPRRPARAHGRGRDDGARAVPLHPRLDRDLLLSAAIVHDLGKTREFTYGAEIARSREGALLGHVELGLRLIASARARRRSRPSAAWRSSTACCCHHGADAASGRRFASAEALALYRLNALDAQRQGRGRARAWRSHRALTSSIGQAGPSRCR